MGKIKTRFIGVEDVEEKQKKEQKTKAYEKKLEKKKIVKKKEKLVEEPVKKSQVKVPKSDSKSSKSEDKAKKQAVSKKSRGKKYREVKKLVDKTKTYTLSEAVSLLKKLKTAKFDESVEIHLNVDETGLRGEVEMPHTTGKTIRVKIVDDKVLAGLEKGMIDFDILITHPSYMPKLAKFAKMLGPRGLMPNPKAGTISLKPEEVAKKFEKGTLRWKTEAKFPLIHQMIGKISHEEKALVENIEAFIRSVGTPHIQKAVVKTTMSPSVKFVLPSQ